MPLSPNVANVSHIFAYNIHFTQYYSCKLIIFHYIFENHINPQPDGLEFAQYLKYVKCQIFDRASINPFFFLFSLVSELNGFNAHGHSILCMAIRLETVNYCHNSFYNYNHVFPIKISWYDWRATKSSIICNCSNNGTRIHWT